MVSVLYFVGVFGLLFGSQCVAFHVVERMRSTQRYGHSSTAVASSTNYLESLSAPKVLPNIPLPAPAELPASQEEMSTSSAITLASDAVASVESNGAVDDATIETEMTVFTPDFRYLPVLSLGHADAIADKVIECCERNGFNPITVYVLDASGSPLVSKRMDGCSPVGVPEFSKAKAYSCIVNKYPSRAFRDRYTSEETSAKFCQMTSMVAVSGNQMAPFPGGILLMVGDTIVGAVGVSGAAGDEDEYCAIRGVVEANLGISTVPEKPFCSTMKDIL